MVWRRRYPRFTIFDVFDELFREIEEIMEEEFRELSRRGLKGPYVYGIRMTIGPDGVPRIEEFGNIRREGARPKIAEEREPLVDVFEEDDKFVIVVEMPGVDKDKIEVSATEEKIVVRASNSHRKYYKEIELPKPIKPETAKAQYKNGVLEIKVEKKEKRKEPEGVKIKVE